MLSVRNAVVAAAALFSVSIMASLLAMVRAPDSGGMGNDSYGTRGYGYRALFELLNELGIGAAREFAPPDSAKLKAGTVVFLNPSPMIVGTEPAYLTGLLNWVNAGGRVVVAPGQAVDFQAEMILGQLKEPPPTFLDAIGLHEVDLIGGGTDEARHQTLGGRSDSSPRDAEGIAGQFLDAMNLPLPPLQEITVSIQGDFGALSGQVRQLTVPADSVASLHCSRPPDGSVTWGSGGDTDRILVARFRQGAGEIVVISDPRLLTNRLISRSDNSILAAGLLAPDGQAVIIDEFYHGLGVRGQPLYLLTHLSYASVTIGILLTLALSTWRKAVFPGPPLPDDVVSRRDIREYIDAMARFFSEGGRGYGRLVEELRNGVLRQLSLETGLPPDTADVDRIAAAMARKDGHRSGLILEATHSVDEALQSRRNWSRSETLDAMRRMSACL